MNSIFITYEAFTNGYRIEILDIISIISIMFLFILMLINVRVSELLSDTSNSIPLAVIISVAFNYPLYEILPYGISSFNSYIFDISNSLTKIFYKDNGFFNENVNLSSNIIENSEVLFVTSKI